MGVPAWGPQRTRVLSTIVAPCPVAHSQGEDMRVTSEGRRDGLYWDAVLADTSDP